jgi:hypothetical protein
VFHGEQHKDSLCVLPRARNQRASRRAGLGAAKAPTGDTRPAEEGAGAGAQEEEEASGRAQGAIAEKQAAGEGVSCGAPKICVRRNAAAGAKI